MLDWANSSEFHVNATLTTAAHNNTSSLLSNDEDYYFQSPELSYAVPVGIILGLFTVLTVGGNLLVLLAVATDRHLRSQRHTLLIVNLAIFDMTLGSIVFPFSATLEVLNDQWLFGRVFCSVWAAIDVLCCTGSIWSLVSIALDRLIGVTRPLAYAGIMTKAKMLTMIIIIWILSLVISVVPFMGWQTPEEKNPYKCHVQTDPSYVIFSCSVSYYVPLIIILIFYSRIYKAAARHVQSMRTGIKRGSGSLSNDGTVMTLRIHTKRFQKSHNATTTRTGSGSETNNANGETGSVSGSTTAKLGKSFAKQRKATITLSLIILGFICMWQGFFLILPISVFCKNCNVPVTLWRIFFWLGYCNSLMNPFIYAAASPEFRRAFKRILCCEIFSGREHQRRSVRDMSNSSHGAASRSGSSGANNRRLTRCWGFFKPFRSCLSSRERTETSTTGTPDSSDVLAMTPVHLHCSDSNTLRSTPGESRSFLGFRLSRKRSDAGTVDLMESFPLASLTLARLKNPSCGSDALYGSLQALQRAAMEDSPSRAGLMRASSSITGSVGSSQADQLLRLSRSCATQTPPVSIPVSPETGSPYHYVFEPSAPDDAEL
ncbi:alpha-1A adrenergic receptor-like [Paramacrobiotus metropolitanus]|uniref:alpha-1A adrenergic receptor-like n=1 Tax=Paramacrobiotus metropolitanus TaxID=2943436 RepID=UPI002446382A|nr:alpha-1A adrenergic receptor-like [Paramacrobiotus metropolitanus]